MINGLVLEGLSQAFGGVTPCNLGTLAVKSESCRRKFGPDWDFALPLVHTSMMTTQHSARTTNETTSSPRISDEPFGSYARKRGN